MIAIYGSENLCEDNAMGKLIVKRSGIVLIDEIDAHMHPGWQRRIGFWLKSHSPKVQFLVTTHSPIICQTADPNGIFKLHQPASGEQPFAVSKADYQTIIAARPDTILLTPAFGLLETRSDLAVEKRQSYAKIRSKNGPVQQRSQ
jgi:predicted ATP-binding protein involved in virulence